jgi:polysaccharide export outer membrane protein
MSLVCPNLTFHLAGARAEAFAVCPEGKQVRISRRSPGTCSDERRESFEARADSVKRGMDGETLTLTGHARLRSFRDGQRIDMAAERVVVNVRTGEVQSCAGVSLPCEARSAPPPCTVAPPDVLSIAVAGMRPNASYRIEPEEVLKVQITGAHGKHLLTGEFTVASTGTIDLGPAYGTIPIAGETLAEAEAAIQCHLKRTLHARVSLSRIRSERQVSGEHLIRADGTICFGTYGCLHVAGMTVAQVKAAVEQYLGEFTEGVEVTVDVAAYNSKVYYLVSDCGNGERVQRIPLTGNETVLDAIVNVPVRSAPARFRIWVARPNGHNESMILPVDWRAITSEGSMSTNYSLHAGDRVYVKSVFLHGSHESRQ